MSMNADQVRALIRSKYPQALSSPLAQLFSGVVASDEASRAIGFAKLQAKASRAQMKRDAHEHALSCIDACEAADIEYDSETLSANIECNFPELEIEECDDIASAAIAKAVQS